MSSSRNKVTGGLRFLWIPGKKKNNHKGRYDTTKKPVTPNGNNKKITADFGQKELFKSESVDLAETSSSVLPAIGGAAACATVPKVKLNSDDEDSDDEKKENDQNDENGECPALDKDGNVILHDGNTATFRKGAKVSRNNPDFDSIEELTEPECNFKNSAVDLTDSAICATKKKNRKSKKRKNKKLSENSEDEPKNEKIIDCLYVGLMCCECVIS